MWCRSVGKGERFESAMARDLSDLNRVGRELENQVLLCAVVNASEWQPFVKCGRER